MAVSARANLPERWSLESFPWSRQPTASMLRKQVRAFAELDFVAKHRKSSVGGADRRGQNGTRVRSPAEGCGRMATAASSFARKICSTKCTPRWPIRSTRQLLNRLARLDRLIDRRARIFKPGKPEQSNTFFKLMEERYTRHSTIITTNLRSMTNGTTSSVISRWWTRCLRPACGLTATQ